MELKLNDKHELIGKIESINQGNHFINTTIILADKTHANIRLGEDLLKTIEMGKVYFFNCDVARKRDEELTLKASKITPIEALYKNAELAEILANFYTYAPLPAKMIKKQIEGFINKIDNKILKDITKKIYNNNKDVFYIHPAATKFHHAYIGGLSFHTLTMLKMIDPFIDIYPYLNKDLLYAGTILHDMSKIKEISGVDGEYTKEGLLIGHLVMQTIEIDKVAKELKYHETEEVLLLKHMILSHHGLLNFGSAKKPQIAEALLLWQMDTIDSKMMELGDVLKDTKDGEFTQSVQVLDKMRFYKPNLKKNNKIE